jgi:hypothetical protein
MLGAMGEQLAVYHGRQAFDGLCGSSGRRVYLYPYQYLSNGGKLIFRSDSTKMYQITDNLGSVRSVVELNLHNRGVAIKSYDYKPFGDSLKDTFSLLKPNLS